MNFRDVELLSAYLDGQLNPSDSARLETRLSSNSQLRAVMDDLREARGLLRQLPARKAPRNFTLTRKMVGLKPPLPRTYSTFRFATVFAALLLFLTFAVNGFSSRPVSFMASAPAPAYGIGGGGETESLEAPAATEAPAAIEAPAQPSTDMQIAPTEMSPATENSARSAETPQAKTGEGELLDQNQAQVPNDAVVPIGWQVGLGIVIVVCGLAAFGLRQLAVRKWR